MPLKMCINSMNLLLLKLNTPTFKKNIFFYKLALWFFKFKNVEQNKSYYTCIILFCIRQLLSKCLKYNFNIMKNSITE